MPPTYSFRISDFEFRMSDFLPALEFHFQFSILYSQLL
jgi:hypothetical protein